MSQVYLLTADRPLPLYESGLRRLSVLREHGQTVTWETEGFSVREHRYYRCAVEELGLPLKPYRYELNLEVTEQDAQRLRDYLEKNLAPGERVELWSLWVGDGPSKAVRFSGRLSDLAQDTLKQMETGRQICLCVER